MTQLRHRAVWLAALIVGATIGCAPRAPQGADPLSNPRDGCPALPAIEERRLASSDSLLLCGETEIARDRYRDLAATSPACALLWSRLGDASRALYDREEAIASYETALELDPCLPPSAVGLFALSVPLSAGSGAGLETLASDIDTHRRHCPSIGIERVSWRVDLLRGERARAERTLRDLGEGSLYAPAARELAANVLSGLDAGTVYVSGSDVETDLLAHSARERGVVVVDFDLLNHPAYVEALVIQGLPCTLSEGDVARLSAFWSDELERRISVAEQVLRHVIEEAANRAIVFSARFRAPIVYELGESLTLRGLSWHLDGNAKSVDAADVDEALASATLDAFRTYRPGITGTGAYVAAELQRLLSNYVHAALNGAVAAYRAEDRERVERLMRFADACLDPLHASAGLRLSVSELAKDLAVPS